MDSNENSNENKCIILSWHEEAPVVQEHLKSALAEGALPWLCSHSQVLQQNSNWVSLYLPGKEQGVLAEAEGTVLPPFPHAALGAVSLEMFSCQVKQSQVFTPGAGQRSGSFISRAEDIVQVHSGSSIAHPAAPGSC